VTTGNGDLDPADAADAEPAGRTNCPHRAAPDGGRTRLQDRAVPAATL